MSRLALPMDVKSEFNIVSLPTLSRRLEELCVERDLVLWTDSSMSGRKDGLVLENEKARSR